MKKLQKKKQLSPTEVLSKAKIVWYKKLKDSGFEDIERDELYLKRYSGSLNESGKEKLSYTKRRLHWESTGDYYSMAAKFLHDYKFTSNLEKVIWEYHAEGMSMRNIAKTLKKLKLKKFNINKDKVNSIVKPLVLAMKRMYLVGFK